MTDIKLHHGDLPADIQFGDVVAVDTETMGLRYGRDRLCVVQISAGDNKAHLVKFDGKDYSAPNLKAVLGDPKVTKIFHFARFDVGVIKLHFDIECSPVYCTRIASKIARTYTDRHGLKDVCRELLDIEISKQQQSSDWGAETLSDEQIEYAAKDVLYLHRLKEELDGMLSRENRLELAQQVFAALPMRANLDLAGWRDLDIFEH